MQPKKRNQGQARFPPVMARFENNSILRPDPNNWWNTTAILNPAANYEGGKVQIIYLAIGDTDNSPLGYASIFDGYSIHETLNKSQIWHQNC
jgi:hypothetical protein